MTPQPFESFLSSLKVSLHGACAEEVRVLYTLVTAEMAPRKAHSHDTRPRSRPRRSRRPGDNEGGAS